MVGDVVAQPLLIFAHMEEVILLLDELRSNFVIRAKPIHELFLRIEPLASEAIQSTVFAERNITRIVDFLQNVLHGAHMVRICGANETIGMDMELRPQLPELLTDAIHESLGRLLAGSGAPCNLVSMFIGSGQEIRAQAQQAMVARQSVCQNGCVRSPDVRLGIDIVNRSGDVKGLSHDGDLLSEDFFFLGRRRCRRELLLADFADSPS